MDFTVDLELARAAFDESAAAFLAAVAGLSDYELLGRSRCHGWTRLDVLTHVVAGWQEMVGGLITQVDDAPTVDAASYWTAFAAATEDDDPIAVLLSQRRRSDAYLRPSSARAHLNSVAATVRQGAGILADRPCSWQQQVFTAGDFLAVWAVENAVHHLDLDLDDAPPSALTLARGTIEALAGGPLPPAWSDVDAVLIGTGRHPVPNPGDRIASRLPVLG